MNADEFDELAGRIEALARVVLHLVARLEIDEVIDGPAFASGLRESIALRSRSPVHLAVAQRTLGELAKALDEARHWRRFRGQVERPPTPANRRRAA